MNKFQIAILFLTIGTVIGCIIGQISVFRKLRKTRYLKIDHWEYSARDLQNDY